MLKKNEQSPKTSQYYNWKMLDDRYRQNKERK